MSRLLSTNAVLWIIQVFLALFFALASGAPKLLLPANELPMPIPLPQAFVWLIGTCEVLGALALVLPSAVRVASWLTPLAAACLALLTVCATIYQLMGNQPANALFALIIGALCAAVAYARRDGRAVTRRGARGRADAGARFRGRRAAGWLAA